MRVASILLLVIVGCSRELARSANAPGSSDVRDPVALCESAFRARDFSIEVSLTRREKAWQIAGISYFLRDRNPTDSDLAPLGSLKTLDRLELRSYWTPQSRATLSADAVKDLARLRLKRLLLRHTPTDECMRAICTLADLEDLDLCQSGAQTEVGDGGLAGLGNLRKLRRLDLTGAGLTAKSLSYIVPLQGLEELSLAGNSKITDGALIALGGLKNLRALRLETLGPKGLATLERMPGLERLSVDTFVASAGHSDLSVLKNLKQIEVFHVMGDLPAVVRLPETVRSLRWIAGMDKVDIRSCKNIERVQLFAGRGAANWPKNPELNWVYACRGLRELTLDDAADADVSAVAVLTSLRVLRIAGPCEDALGDNGMRALAGLRQLECLSYQNSGLADAGRAVLPTLTGLRRLDLTFAPRLTARGLEGVWLLKELRSLKLDLSGESLEDSADRVLTHVKSLSKLEELSLKARVTDEGLRNLVDLKSLRRLDLESSNGYTDAGLKRLIQALPGLEELTFKIEAKPKE